MESWKSFFENLNTQQSYKTLISTVDNFYSKKVIFPPKENMFEAFSLTPIDRIKVIIIGQDPYHQQGQAHGLAFSVLPDQVTPPSLKNIYKEIESDIGESMNYKSGHLRYLSIQGVFLLNTLLTVEANKPLSHKGIGYEFFIECFFNYIDKLQQPIVFLLWGSESKKYQRFITHPNRLVLTAHHPSPLSANRGGWFGCKHFSKTNDYLESVGLEKINWKNT
jgi:uracil-DNA glycosylase